jgi:hypothetical protein
MPFRINLYGPIRDRAHPSEIAAERPAFVTRHHESAYEPIASETEGQQTVIRGQEGDSRCGEFNAALRRGAHGNR